MTPGHIQGNQRNPQDGAIAKRDGEHDAADRAREPALPGVDRRLVADPGRLSPRDILYLQRTAGNQAVARLLGRQPAPPRNPSPIIQSKLAVGPAGDKYEREADAIVQNLNLGRPQGQVSARVQPARAGRVQHAPVIGSEGGMASGDVESRIRRSQSGGRALPSSVRQTLEPKLGADLSRVKVHTDSHAVQLNRELGAKAFTHQNHIYYGAGQSPSDMGLTAHEAVHTIQQGAVQQVRRKDNAGMTSSGAGVASISSSYKQPHISRQTVPSIQRAVGVELECSNLEITWPEDGKKGTTIKGNPAKNWKAVWEDTSAGANVVEFVVDPPANTKKELTDAIGAMQAMALMFEDDNYDNEEYGHNVNGYYVMPKGPIEGAIQISLGMPLEYVQQMYQEFPELNSIGTSKGLGRMEELEKGKQVGKEVTTKKWVEEEYDHLVSQKKTFLKITTKKAVYEKRTREVYKEVTEMVYKTVYETAPDGTPVKDLPDATKGFLILVWDYIRKSYVPEEYQSKMVDETYIDPDTKEEKTRQVRKGASIPFVKGLFPVMARTDFNAIFDTLPSAEIIRMTEMDPLTGNRVMKEAWWKWIIKKGLGNDNLSEKFLEEDALVNYFVHNFDDKNIGTKRGDWLKYMPTEDTLMQGAMGKNDLGQPQQYNFLGHGELGRKADKTASGKMAPVFELRKPYGSSMHYSGWMSMAKETWDKYEKIVGEQVKFGSKVAKYPKPGRGLPPPNPDVQQGRGLPPPNPDDDYQQRAQNLLSAYF